MSLQKAAEDMKYLLDRGYNRNTALNLVVNRYHLDEKERNYLRRFVYSEDEIKNHESKIMPVEDIRGGRVVVDGFNVLITVQAVLNSKEIVKGMDGILRDLSGVYSNYKFNKESMKAVDAVLNVLLEHKPRHVLFIFDSQISRSGELSSHVLKRMDESGIAGESGTSKTADREIIDLNRITASSDSVIIEKIDKILDLAELIRLKKEK